MDLENNYIFFDNIECMFTDIDEFKYYKDENIYEYLKLDFGMNTVEQHCKLYLYYLIYKNCSNYFIEFNMKIKNLYEKKHRVIYIEPVDLIKCASFYGYYDYKYAFKYIDWCLENNLPPIEADTEELYKINTRI